MRLEIGFWLHIACSEMCQKIVRVIVHFSRCKNESFRKNEYFSFQKNISGFLSVSKTLFFSVFIENIKMTLLILSLRGGRHGMLQSREWR